MNTRTRTTSACNITTQRIIIMCFNLASNTNFRFQTLLFSHMSNEDILGTIVFRGVISLLIYTNNSSDSLLR